MAEMEREARDALLIQLAQRCGGIEPMLDSIFSFLKRKTDYYHIQKEGDRIGFPEGVAERMVAAAFQKYVSDETARKPDPRALHETATRLQGEREVDAGKGKTGETHSNGGEGKVHKESSGAGGGGGGVAAGADPGGGKGSHGGSAMGVNGQALKKDGFNGFVAYNGGECDQYRWSQTVDDFSICVDLGGTHTSKEVYCDISKTHLKVGLKAGGDPILEGKLFGEVRQEDAVWSLEEKRFLNVQLEKHKKRWWKSALEGGEEIDTQKVDSTCKLEDYDQPTQAAIGKVMFDEHQKRKGLPTSDEMSQHELLKKAWDAEGSPFKGQPFDPSLVNFAAK